MRTYALAALAVGLVAAAAFSQNDPAKEELQRFQGTWIGVSVEMDGQKVPDDEAKAITLIIQGGKYVLKNGDQIEEQGTFQLDPAKNPKALDATPSEGPSKGQTMQGIYEIDGDNYKVCFAQFGKDRPKEFSSKGDEGLVLSVWKKAKK